MPEVASDMGTGHQLILKTCCVCKLPKLGNPEFLNQVSEAGLVDKIC